MLQLLQAGTRFIRGCARGDGPGRESIGARSCQAAWGIISEGMTVAAILPAAGHGTRMGKAAAVRYGSDRKQFMRLAGEPILALTIRKFLAVSSVREILVAVPEGSLGAVQDMLGSVGATQR